MGLMRRETLLNKKRAMRKMDFRPQIQEYHALVDHGLAALDEIAGGTSTIDQRADLAERERQVKLALADLREVITKIIAHEPVVVEGHLHVAIRKARFTLDMVDQMLR